MLLRRRCWDCRNVPEEAQQCHLNIRSAEVPSFLLRGGDLIDCQFCHMSRLSSNNLIVIEPAPVTVIVYIITITITIIFFILRGNVLHIKGYILHKLVSL